MPKLQPGSYYGRFQRGVLTELGQNKNPAFVMTFEVTHYAGMDGDWVPIAPNPEHRDITLWCTDKAWPYTEKKLQSFGFTGDFAKPDFADAIKQDGTELVCTEENGYERWDFPAGERAPADPLPAEKVRLFNAKWKTNNAAAQKPAGAPPAPPQRRVVHQAKAAGSAPAAAPTTPAAATAMDDGPPF